MTLEAAVGLHVIVRKDNDVIDDDVLSLPCLPLTQLQN